MAEYWLILFGLTMLGLVACDFVAKLVWRHYSKED